jgi:hypothetical protein
VKDPLRFGGGDANLYGYVLNDPINLTDPDGQISPKIREAILGLALGAMSALGHHADDALTRLETGKLGGRRGDEVIERERRTTQNRKKNKRGEGDPEGGFIDPELPLYLIPWWATPTDLGCDVLDCDHNGIPDDLEEEFDPC